MDKKKLLLCVGAVMIFAGLAHAGYNGTYEISDMTPISRRKKMRGYSRGSDGYGTCSRKAKHRERRGSSHAGAADLADGRSSSSAGGRSRDALQPYKAKKAHGLKTTGYPHMGVPISLLLFSSSGYALQDSFTIEDAGKFLVRVFGGLSLGTIDSIDSLFLIILAGFVFFLFLLVAVSLAKAITQALKKT